MRDPKRIEKHLEVLGKVWRQNPDLRLGQLLLSVTGDVAPTLFHVEDEELLSALFRVRTKEGRQGEESH